VRRSTQATIFGFLSTPTAQDLRVADKLILVYLAWRQGSNGKSWPSLKTIEDDLGVCRRTCLRAIARLCESGCIEKMPGSPGRGHSNRYVVKAGKRTQGVTYSAEGKGRTSPPFDARKGRILSPEKDAPCVLKEPLNEPTKSAARHACAKPRTRKVQVHEYAPDFERFWEAYPKKVNKFEAFEAWAALGPSVKLAEKIIATVGAYSKTDQWTRSLAEDGGRFIPNATTFLNQHRYDDAPLAKPEPQRGDPGWLPTEEEARETIQRCAMEAV